jgi:hypothetical protein
MNHINTLLKTGHIAAASLVLGLASAGAHLPHKNRHLRGSSSLVS